MHLNLKIIPKTFKLFNHKMHKLVTPEILSNTGIITTENQITMMPHLFIYHYYVLFDVAIIRVKIFH